MHAVSISLVPRPSRVFNVTLLRVTSFPGLGDEATCNIENAGWPGDEASIDQEGFDKGGSGLARARTRRGGGIADIDHIATVPGDRFSRPDSDR